MTTLLGIDPGSSRSAILERPGLERKERPPKDAPFTPEHLRQVVCVHGHVGDWYVNPAGFISCRPCRRDGMRTAREGEGSMTGNGV